MAFMTEQEPRAFVCVKTDVGFERECFQNLKNIPEIKEIYLVYGVYDIILLVQADCMDNLKKLITQKIRVQEYIRSSLSMITL